MPGPLVAGLQGGGSCSSRWESLKCLRSGQGGCPPGSVSPLFPSRCSKVFIHGLPPYTVSSLGSEALLFSQSMTRGSVLAGVLEMLVEQINGAGSVHQS